MSECFDCGELFDGFGDCPKCGSENIGVVEPTSGEGDEEKSFWEDFYDEENDNSHRFPG